MSTTATIDKSPAAIGKRREAVASALANNALEGYTFGSVETPIIQRYIDGEIDDDELRAQFLALPIE